ncbi:MAG: hypothetical protein KDD69_06290 [Bdellovibrionales bacterium]|nr:hypothetical protein [Bdellovibrionales bacterium]
MTPFSKFLIATLAGSALLLPYFASSRGWGVGSERNAGIAALAAQDCLRKDAAGRCIAGHRSYFRRRNYIGGGMRSGK